MTLKGDLAESWEGSADFKTWTFKLRQGVKWHVPPLKGRELVAEDVKYAYEAYAKEGVQSFTFQEIDGMETPDKYTIRIHLKTPNTMFPQNVAEPVAVIFPREVLEEDGDLKKRMIGTGPFIMKENERKVKWCWCATRTTLRKGIRTSTSTASSRPRCGDAPGGFPYRAERLAGAAKPVRCGGGAEDQPEGGRAGKHHGPGAVWPHLESGQAPLTTCGCAGPSLAIDRQKQVDTVYEGHGILGWGALFVLVG